MVRHFDCLRKTERANARVKSKIVFRVIAMTAHPLDSSVTSASLYEQDYWLWLETTAKLLRSGRLHEVDVDNLAEEIEDMGRSEKRSVESNLEVVLMHLLKYKYQPARRSSSWRYTLLEHRNRLRKALRESPSLRPYYQQVFKESYETARKLAAVETDLPIAQFPAESPFTPEQALDADYLPD